MTQQQWFEKLATDFPNGFFSLESDENSPEKTKAYVGKDYLPELFDSIEDALKAVHDKLSENEVK